MDKIKIAKDKWLHFGVSCIVSIFSPMLAIGLGLGKEYGDKTNGCVWDWYDILADACGVVVGGAIHFAAFGTINI